MPPKAPARAFGLYAVATRRPEALLREVDLQPVKAGVYTVRALHQPITVIVLKEVATATRNALWALFSFDAERVAQGAQDYVWRQSDHAPILQELYHRYQHVGIAMAYTFEDFQKDLARRLVLELPPEERLRGLPRRSACAACPRRSACAACPRRSACAACPRRSACAACPGGAPARPAPEERLRGLPPEERLRGLSEEELHRLKQLLDGKLKH